MTFKKLCIRIQFEIKVRASHLSAIFNLKFITFGLLKFLCFMQPFVGNVHYDLYKIYDVLNILKLLQNKLHGSLKSLFRFITVLQFHLSYIHF